VVIEAPQPAPRIDPDPDPHPEIQPPKEAEPPPKPASEPKKSGTSDRSNSEERTLLETARTAMLRGDRAGALEKLEQHEKRFPHGRLAEERDAMRVIALAGVGRSDEARARGAAFAIKYPKSLLLPAVQEALGR
jgi:hypothetical protein